MEPLINKKIPLIKRVVILFIMAFACLKIAIFPQRLYYILKIAIMDSKGKYVSPHDRQFAFSIWTFLTSLAESLLFAFLLYYTFLLIRRKDTRRTLIRICLVTASIFYPVLFFSNYLIIGKNSLFAVIPYSISVMFLLIFASFFAFAIKIE